MPSYSDSDLYDSKRGGDLHWGSSDMRHRQLPESSRSLRCRCRTEWSPSKFRISLHLSPADSEPAGDHTSRKRLKPNRTVMVFKYRWWINAVAIGTFLTGLANIALSFLSGQIHSALVGSLCILFGAGYLIFLRIQGSE